MTDAAAVVAFFRRTIYHYAVACDLFPEIGVVWDMPYLEQCYDESRIPHPDRLLGPLQGDAPLILPPFRS